MASENGGRTQRLRRIAAAALAATAGIVGLAVVPPWVTLYVPARILRQAEAVLLDTLQALYVLAVVGALVGVAFLWRRLERGHRAGRRVSATSFRLLLLAASTLFAAGVAEAVAWTRWSLLNRAPVLSEHQAAESPGAGAPSNEGGDVRVVVVGESSASGVPYQDRLSIGAIVGWKLQDALPNRKVRVEMLARSGATLAEMHAEFAELRYRPDVVIVYAGHNEFSARYSWSDGGSAYYDDLRALRVWETAVALPARVSAVCALMKEAADGVRIGAIPPPWVTRRLVDVPVYTPAEYAARRDDYRARLDAIASYCARIGALAVLIVPPANDAGFEPSRSALEPSADRAERERVAAECRRLKDVESADPAAAERDYRALVGRHPGFAEAHYRLGRVLEQRGAWAEAYEHYVTARDRDVLPMRCPSDFQQACREVAAARGASLVDGQAIFRSESVKGLLDDTMFNDAMHPSLRGHVSLARSSLERIRAWPKLGWRADDPVPTVDAAECARHFGLVSEEWVAVCQLCSAIWKKLAYARFDPSERLRWADRYEQAVKQIAAGKGPGDLGIPGFVLGPPAAASR